MEGRIMIALYFIITISVAVAVVVGIHKILDAKKNNVDLF